MRMLVVIALLCSLGVASSAETTITAMSFNVRYGSADDGPNSWDLRKEMVVGVIERANPDVVGTQETLGFQAAYLGEALANYDHFGMGRETRNRGERMEIFYRRDTLAPVENGHFWLSETPDIPGTRSWRSANTRMVSWAKFYHLPTKGFFYYFNTHFDHRSELAREEAAEILYRHVKKLPKNSVAIVTGDFNAIAEESAPWKTMTRGRLSDAFLDAREQVGPADTWSTFDPASRTSFRRIDWILYAGDATVDRFETIDYNESGRYPSDHYPVIATFRWDDE